MTSLRTRKTQKKPAARLPLFIPLFDSMAREYGPTVAGLYGLIWRHCPMNRGRCPLPIGRVATMLGSTHLTVTRHLRRLVDDGYLEDLTPQAKHTAHTYRLTSRFHTSIELHVINEDLPPEAL